MIRKHLMSNAVSSLKLEFKHRKIIHYTLLAAVIFLQISAIIFWYFESATESENEKLFHSVKELSRISHFKEKINDSFMDSQRNFNAFKSTNDPVSFTKYNQSLNDISNLIDSLNFAVKDNKEFQRTLNQKKQSQLDILVLKSNIDSILKKQIKPGTTNLLNLFRLNKFQYKKILDSIKTDTYLKVDSVSQKGLFSRLGDALAGRRDIQKEQLKIIVTMKYNDKVVTGSIEDQIANLFLTTNQYYENQFKNLKISFANLKEEDSKLTKFNDQLLNLQTVILPDYSQSVNLLEDQYQNKIQHQFHHNKTVRNYTLVVLIALMFIVSLILFGFTRITFEYEKRLTTAKNQIRQSLNFKNRIMGMMSHEIRSPLSIISIYSKMIGSSIKDPEIQQTFKSIQFTTNSLLLLSSQILEYSKDEKHSLRLKNKPFELKNEISQIIHSMSSLVETKGNTIKLNSSLQTAIEVDSDAAKIHQLFYNIIGNANKFTNNGLINIDIYHEKLNTNKLNLKIEIRDNGTGIAKSDLKNIFELYYQGEVSGKVNDLGVGLGLNLCKEIIELFEGQINIESQQDHGTTVVFNLILNLA